MRRIRQILIVGLILMASGIGLLFASKSIILKPTITASPLPSPTSTPKPTPTPSPSPLTFAQMNERFGPCAFVPVLMYHHVQNLDQAKAEGHQSLTVGDDYFRQQLVYLRDHGYQVIRTQDLINFFETGTSVPSKSVLLTFDDGYVDFNTTAYPILKEFGYSATVFLSTGLTENPGYLSWNAISDMNNSGLVLFANHTWSHRNVGAENAVVEKEIGTADTQLKEHGLNSPKVFAYPYGFQSDFAETYLAQNGYQLAFTTNPGSTQCKKLRFELPRLRIGNATLTEYGF